MIKRVLGALAAIALTAPSVGAVTVEERRNHLQIVDALEQVDVSLYVNSKELCRLGGDYYYGAYIAYKDSIVICQKGQPLNGNATLFTAEDLDTLRHETHHLIQDCVDGKIDGRLSPFFEEAQFKDILKNYPQSKIDKIYEVYLLSGHSNEEIRLEIEAFVVADFITPEVLSRAVKQLCGPAQR